MNYITFFMCLFLISLAIIQFILGRKNFSNEWSYLIPICYVALRLAITADAQGNMKISIIGGLVIAFILRSIFNWGKSSRK